MSTTFDIRNSNSNLIELRPSIEIIGETHSYKLHVKSPSAQGSYFEKVIKSTLRVGAGGPHTFFTSFSIVIGIRKLKRKPIRWAFCEAGFAVVLFSYRIQRCSSFEFDGHKDVDIYCAKSRTLIILSLHFSIPGTHSITFPRKRID